MAKIRECKRRDKNSKRFPNVDISLRENRILFSTTGVVVCLFELVIKLVSYGVE